MPTPNKTRAGKNGFWVERYCVHPDGPHQGDFVMLTKQERETLRQTYDTPEGPGVVITGRLGAFLALLHIAGPEARGDFRPELETDAWSMWRAAGPDLRQYLRRDGERIVCPELGTAYPGVAA